MRFSAKKYVLEREYPLNRKAVWQLLSDTDRLNRLIGLFSVKFSTAKNSEGSIFYREALAKVAGIVPIFWKEYPFEWNEYEDYMVERQYEGGPLKSFIGGIELEDAKMKLPDGTVGTKVRLFAEFTPRNILGVLAIPITGLKSMKNTINYLDSIVKSVENKSPSTVKIKRNTNVSELNRLEKKLKETPIHIEYINHLHDLLVYGDESDVAKINPKSVAKEWNADPHEVLRLFLYATKIGILNLDWNLICPNCRVSKVNYTTLSQLEEAFHCDLCGITYNASFGKYVELNFAVHPSIRRAFDQSYCVSGPMITPHVKIQQIVKRGESRKLDISDPSGMRLRVLQANHIVTLNISDKLVHPNQSISYTNEGWETTQIEMAKNTTVLITNNSSSDKLFVFEKAEWSKEVITAAQVTSMQEFRDLFSEEILSPGQRVGIENVTILFSDLQGSTSLYESLGDANAYSQVREHFDYLSKWIKKNSGSVVKTIGDAVMAIFYVPEDGVNAALQIQKHISELRENGKEHITLKIGLYSGPAIAVNSNDRLDYFGRTVNIAARIQGQSIGNDIVLSKEYFENKKIIELLNDQSIEIQDFKANLKGIEENIDLVKIKLH
ncbi:adenylate/guanylate cyclase domain-containing protein [Bacillus sp. JJ664]